MSTLIFKERDFIFEVFSLRPNTTYFFYVNKIQNTNRIKQFGKKLNQSLITDENGYMKLVYYIDSNIPSDTAQGISSKILNLKASNLELVLTTLNQSSLPENFENSTVSYAKSIVKLSKV